MAFSHKVNQANVEEHPASVPIPAGEYAVRIAESVDAISKKSGKDMIKLELEITEGKFARRKLFQYIVDDQYADQKIYDILPACGVAIPDTVTSATFRNLRGRVKTKSRLYNGEERAEVSYWIKSRTAAAPATAAPAGQPPAENANGAPDITDDIPF